MRRGREGGRRHEENTIYWAKRVCRSAGYFPLESNIPSRDEATRWRQDFDSSITGRIVADAIRDHEAVSVYEARRRRIYQEINEGLKAASLAMSIRLRLL